MHKQIVRMPLHEPQPQRKIDWLWRELNLQECDSLTIEDFDAIDSVPLPAMRLDLAPLIMDMRK